jgi:predicted transposase/invertase (TIGR01784 family)
MLRVVLKPDDQKQIADILYDQMFKAVFAGNSQNSHGAIEHLLKAIIGRDLKVIGIKPSEPAVKDEREKQIRFDVHCDFATGEHAEIEVTLYPDLDEAIRSEYYLARLHNIQMTKGVKYKDFKASYQITFFGNETYYDDEFFLHSFEFYDKEHNIALGGITRIFTIELTKLESILKKSVDEMSQIERWSIYLYYLKDETKLDVINQIVEKEEGVAMATAELLEFTRDNPEAVRRFQREKHELDAQVAELRKQELRKVVAEKDTIIKRMADENERIASENERIANENAALKAKLAAAGITE